MLILAAFESVLLAFAICLRVGLDAFESVLQTCGLDHQLRRVCYVDDLTFWGPRGCAASVWPAFHAARDGAGLEWPGAGWGNADVSGLKYPAAVTSLVAGGATDPHP